MRSEQLSLPSPANHCFKQWLRQRWKPRPGVPQGTVQEGRTKAPDLHRANRPWERARRQPTKTPTLTKPSEGPHRGVLHFRLLQDTLLRCNSPSPAPGDVATSLVNLVRLWFSQVLPFVALIATSWLGRLAHTCRYAPLLSGTPASLFPDRYDILHGNRAEGLNPSVCRGKAA